jgi:hypothetical protein
MSLSLHRLQRMEIQDKTPLLRAAQHGHREIVRHWWDYLTPTPSNTNQHPTRPIRCISHLAPSPTLATRSLCRSRVDMAGLFIPSQVEPIHSHALAANEGSAPRGGPCRADRYRESLHQIAFFSHRQDAKSISCLISLICLPQEDGEENGRPSMSD